MSAPLTTAALGSTRCVGCEKRFADTPWLSTTVVPAQEQLRNRYGGLSGPQGTRTVMRRWHLTCLEELEAQNAAYREQVAADREQMVRDLCAAAGIDYTAISDSEPER